MVCGSEGADVEGVVEGWCAFAPLVRAGLEFRRASRHESCSGGLLLLFLLLLVLLLLLLERRKGGRGGAVVALLGM